MAVVQYANGIEYVKGSLAKATKNKEGHKHGTYLIGTHREAPTLNPNCTRLYSRKAVVYDRTGKPISADERAARMRFTAVAQAVAARKKDLSKIQADTAAFNAQKDEPNGIKTMRAWYWKVEGDAYDDQH
jgi:hypothetical protein